MGTAAVTASPRDAEVQFLVHIQYNAAATHWKLDHVPVRGRISVRDHALMSVIVLQARALAYPLEMRRRVAKAA